MQNPSKELVNKIIKDRKVRRDLAKKSHEWFFAIYLGDYIQAPSAPFHEDFFQITEDQSIKNAVIIAFRNSAKSTIFNLSYPLWAILGHQQKKLIVIASQTQRQARQHLLNIKKELETNTLLRMDLGPFKEETDEWGSLALVIPRYGAKIMASSTEQSIRGLRHGRHRPDLIIGDDLEDLESVKTQESRDKLFAWFNGDVIPAGDSNTRIIVIGNLLHDDSLLMKLIERIEQKTFTGIYRKYPLIDQDGNITWPGRFPNQESIEALKLTMNNSAFQREFMLKILPDDDQVIHPDWIQYYDNLPLSTDLGFRYSAIGIDLAISEATNADYTAMVSGRIFGQQDRLKIYIAPNPINERMGYPETLQRAKDFSRNMNMARLFIESVAYQTALIQQLKNDHYPAEEYRVQGNDKRSRLATVALFVQSGVIVFPRHGCEKLIAQILGFGRERHDDLVDAFTTLILKVMEKEGMPDEYTYLVSREQLEQSCVPSIDSWMGPLRIGVVIADLGRTFTTMVLRSQNTGQIIHQDTTTNPAAIVEKVIELTKKYHILPSNVFVERLGLGEQVYDMLHDRLSDYEIGQNVAGVIPGAEPEDIYATGKSFLNIRSQAMYRVAQWIKNGQTRLEKNSFIDLVHMKYKIHDDQKVGVQTRQEMMKEGFGSPDAVDALALTFAREKNIALRKRYVQPPYIARSPYEGGASSEWED